MNVVIPWNNRPEIGRTVASNAPGFKAHGLGVTVVNCGGDFEQLRELIRPTMIDAILVNLPSCPFNPSLARNLGIAHSPSDYLLMLDADVIMSEQTLSECLLRMGSDRMLTITRMREEGRHPRRVASQTNNQLEETIRSSAVEFMWSTGETPNVETFRWYSSDGSRGGQGQLLVLRDHLLAIDGYSSSLKGWGFEDIDILVRLQHVRGLKHERLGEVMHLSHSDQSRALGGTNREANNQRNFEIASAAYRSGHFQGTLSKDLADHLPQTELHRLRAP